MKTKSLSDRVDDTRVWYGLGDNIRQIEFDEVDAVEDTAAFGCVSDLDQDHEHDRDEKQEGRYKCPDESSPCRSLDLSL